MQLEWKDRPQSLVSFRATANLHVKSSQVEVALLRPK